MIGRAASVVLAGIVAFVVALLGGSAHADYRFGVPRMTMEVDIRPDASAELAYEIVFDNSGQTIDVVDVGMPHDRYRIDTMHAWVNDQPVTSRIKRSTYIDNGVEVPLGALGIARGQTGVFRFKTIVPDIVFSDTTDDALASFRITPTWFDPGLVQGTTDLWVHVRLPPGVANDAMVKHQGRNFDRREIVDGRTVVSWHFASTRIVDAHMVAVSFPRASMQRVVEITRWDLLLAWWEEATGARVIAFIVTVVLFGIAFFFYTGGTGWSLFMFALFGYGVVAYVSSRAQLWSIPVLALLGIVLMIHLRRLRRTYLPPIISTQGGGIKRGLTAPEAAVLLELPLARVLTLVVFGLLKKGLVAQTGSASVRTIGPLRDVSRAERLKIAGYMGVVIHAYEHGFLDAFANEHAIATVDGAMKELLEHTVERVSGFDVKQTREYYRKVVERAWSEAESLGSIEIKESAREEKLDRRLEWLWLDDRASSRWQRLESRGWAYTAPWVRDGGNVASIDGAGSGGMPAAPSGPSLGRPSFGDVAASFTGWAEGKAGDLSQALLPQRGVDFGTADQTFSAILQSLGEGGGGGGGGGGGCACACAGCACACACAGGGR